MRSFMLAVLVFSLGCHGGTPSAPGVKDAILVFKLPESADPPEYAPERIARITINGKEVPAAQSGKLTVNWSLAGNSEKLKITLSYWPNSYTNFLRKREIEVESGKTLELDLTEESSAIPDEIFPIYFPTPPEVVEAMCKLGEVGEKDVVYDIGCGDGRLVITSVQKFNVRRALGVDIDPGLVRLSRENAKEAKVQDRAEFKVGDALKMDDYSEATVVLMYMSKEIMEKMLPLMKKSMKPGTRIVSHRFTFPQWEPEKTLKLTATNNFGKPEDYVLHLWTVK